MTVFTGAGISTGSGIPDYRSGYNTVLETGPGCWEKAALKQKFKEDCKQSGKALPLAHRVNFATTIQQARPSVTHMALVELQNRGILKGVVSQNIDGLHLKSGIDPDKIAEIHGNTNLEECMKCGRWFPRDYKVRTATRPKEHKTGRKCETQGCNGDLKDTIINFGEYLNQDVGHKGYAIHAASDLVICMGSSMRVPPACLMPFEALKNGGKVVMCNLQKTVWDDDCALVIHEKIEKIMEILMAKLQLPIPDFTRTFRLKVAKTRPTSSKGSNAAAQRQGGNVKFTGVD